MDLKRRVFYYKAVGLFYAIILVHSKLAPDCQTIFETADFACFTALLVMCLLLDLCVVDTQARNFFYDLFFKSPGQAFVFFVLFAPALISIYCCWFSPDLAIRESARSWIEFCLFVEGPIGMWRVVRSILWALYYKTYRFLFGYHTVLDIAYWRTFALIWPEHREFRSAVLDAFKTRCPRRWRKTTYFLYGFLLIFLAWFYTYYQYWCKTYPTWRHKRAFFRVFFWWSLVIYFVWFY